MDENKLDSLQKEVVKLEVKVHHLEKQHSDIKSDMRVLQKDIDRKFEDFEIILKSQFSNVNESLKEIQDIVSQSKGAKKAVMTVIAIVGGIGGAISWVYSFFK